MDDLLEEIEARKPTNETGMYLVHHKHDWKWIGAHQWENGEWQPMFDCWCGSRIVNGPVLHGHKCHAESPSRMCTLDLDHDGDHQDRDGKRWKRGARGSWGD